MPIDPKKYAETISNPEPSIEDMWKEWKASGESPDKLEPVMKKIRPVIESHLRKYQYGPLVNKDAYRAEVQKNALKALQSYNPKYGTRLTTHVMNNLKGSHRWALSATNTARIPEHKAKYIQPIANATDELTEELGREPSHEEIAARVGIPVKHVKQIITGNRKDITSSVFEADPLDYGMQRDEEIQDLIRDALDDDKHKQLFDMIYGKNGQPRITSVAEQAKRLGVDQRTVYRMRDHINDTFKEYL